MIWYLDQRSILINTAIIQRNSISKHVYIVPSIKIIILVHLNILNAPPSNPIDFPSLASIIHCIEQADLKHPSGDGMQELIPKSEEKTLC